MSSYLELLEKSNNSLSVEENFDVIGKCGCDHWKRCFNLING